MLKRLILFVLTAAFLLVSCDVNKNNFNETPETLIETSAETVADEAENTLSANLFDKSSAVQGQIFYHSSSGPEIIDNNDGFYSYVELRGVGTYRMCVSTAHHGDEYALRIPLLDEDKGFVRNATATVIDASNRDAVLVEFEVTEYDLEFAAMYIAFDGDADYLNSLMIVKDIDYPEKFIPYGEIDPNNVLSGKTAIFLGDSICAGTTVGEEIPEYGYGWGGLIGEANNMSWSNFGRNGAVVTDIEGQDRIVTDQIDAALLQYSSVDYVIFEGGTNDADQLDEYPEKLGVVSETNFSDFDITTFSGAFEALILKIKTAYPDAKLGYIIPPKMGYAPYDSASNSRRMYFDRTIEICEKWGVAYIDLWNTSELDPMISDYYDSSLDAAGNIAAGKCYIDAQHLTLTGYNMIVPAIEEFMQGLN